MSWETSMYLNAINILISPTAYQMAPRSWKPDNSVGELISDQQLDLQLEQGARDFMQVFGMQEMPPEELLSAREASLSFSLSGSVDTGGDKGYVWAAL